MKALREIGLRKALRYAWTSFLGALVCHSFLSPLRVALLKLIGARIGANVIVHQLHTFNAYRKGFPGIQLGDNVFVGDLALFDLADDIVLENDVTLAERVTILTHTNVGYADHPLQRHFPPFTAPVKLSHGVFIGTNVTILPGITVGEGTFVAAGSVLTQSMPPWSLVAGVPGRVIRPLEPRAPEYS